MPIKRQQLRKICRENNGETGGYIMIKKLIKSIVFSIAIYVPTYAMWPAAKQVAKKAVTFGRAAMLSTAKKDVTPSTLNRSLFSHAQRIPIMNNASTAVRAHNGLAFVQTPSSSIQGVVPIVARSMSTVANNTAEVSFSDTQALAKAFFDSSQERLENFKKLIEQPFGISLLQDMLTKKNPELLDMAAPYIAQHAETFMQWDEGEILIAKVLHNTIDTALLFEPYITNNIQTALQCPIGRALMVSIAAKDPYKGTMYAEALKAWLANPSKRVIYTESNKKQRMSRQGAIPLKEKIIQEITEPLSDDEKMIYADLYRVLTGNKIAASSCQLMLEFDQGLKELLDIKNASQRAAALALIERMSAFEQASSQNYYTFMHGRKWPYMLPERIYRDFWKHAHNKTINNDFAFALTKPFIYCPDERAKQFEKETELRKKVISEPMNIADVRGARFFMVPSLFDNYRSRGSNPFIYFIRNYNQNDARVRMKDIFTQFNLSELYEEYKKQCEELENEALTLSNFGQILGIAIPKNTVNDVVGYLSVRNSIARPMVTINGEKTDNVQRILEARLSDPSVANNQINFVGAMTDDALLNPESGAIISTFEFPKDQAQYAAWNAKCNELLQTMTPSVKERMARMTQDASAKSAQGK